jgi:hypothetical protein
MTKVRVHSAFLANSAEVKDTLAYVLGGFPEWWTVPALPASAFLAMVVVLELRDDEVDQEYTFDLVVDRLGDTTPIAQVRSKRGRSDRAPGAPILHVIAVNFIVQFETEGPHDFVLLSYGVQLARVPLLVRLDRPTP